MHSLESLACLRLSHAIFATAFAIDSNGDVPRSSCPRHATTCKCDIAISNSISYIEYSSQTFNISTHVSRVTHDPDTKQQCCQRDLCSPELARFSSPDSHTAPPPLLLPAHCIHLHNGFSRGATSRVSVRRPCISCGARYAYMDAQ